MRLLVISLIVIQFAARAANAACTEPTPLDDIPSGAKATREQMLSAQRAMKTYDNAVRAYSDCLHEEGDTSKRTDVAVDKLQKLAERFNAELRAFKARNVEARSE
jgi:hypothetical protein